MAALLAVTFVATQSGEQLERRVGEPAVVQHSALGDRLPWFVLAMLAVSVLVAAAGDHRGPAVVGLVLAVVVVAAVWWTIRVGESGAQAVWGGVISSTDPSGSAPSARMHVMEAPTSSPVAEGRAGGRANDHRGAGGAPRRQAAVRGFGQSLELRQLGVRQSPHATVIDDQDRPS